MSTEATPPASPDASDDPSLTADYVNEPVEAALAHLQEAPDYLRLASFLTSLREGHLFADVTGAVSKKKGPRVRTIRSSRGQLLLPIFTSMEHLRAAVRSGGRRDQAKGILLPAHNALSIIHEDRFVALQLNPGPGELVVLRKYIDLVLGDDPIDAEQLEAMK